MHFFDSYVSYCQEFDEIKLSCDYKLAKMTAEMKKMESKCLATTSDRDGRIRDLQEHNNELCNKLESFEEKYSDQLDISR